MKRLYCVPGGGTTSILFIRWQKLLGEEIKVEYLDIPGRGYLSKKPEQESMRGIAEVMADVIEKKSADTYRGNETCGAYFNKDPCRKGLQENQ